MIIKAPKPPGKRPEGDEFYRLFFPELEKDNLKSDKEAYTRLATATCEAILNDFIRLFDKSYAQCGPGILVIRLNHFQDREQEPLFMPLSELQKDLETADSSGDKEIADYLRSAIDTAEGANVNQCAVVMLTDNSSIRIFLLDRENPSASIRAGLQEIVK
jgi:hypothetical protein